MGRLTGLAKAERDAVLAADYQSGLTCKEVAAKHGLSVSFVQQIITRAGVGRPPGPSRWSMINREEKLRAFSAAGNKALWSEHVNREAITTRYSAGEPIHSIAETVGCSPRTIYAVLAENGIPLRYPKRRKTPAS